MDNVLVPLANAVFAGGNGAIVALLGFVCYALWSERLRLLAQNELAQQRLDRVAEAHAQSTGAIVQSIDGIRVTLLAMRVVRVDEANFKPRIAPSD